VTSTLAPAGDVSSGDAARVRWGPATDLAAVALLAACALILHREGLVGGPAFYELDTRLFYFPLAAWVSQQLHAGNFPLWLPDIFTGYPIFADGESGLAYPLQLALLAVLRVDLAMVWLRVLHVFLAGTLTFALLRTLRLPTLPALGGALVFAFGSFISAQMHHENVVRSAVWLPAALLCMERATPRSGGLRIRQWLMWSALGSLAFALAALGLHIQPVLMTVMALGMYAAFRALVGGRSQSPIWPLASCAAIALGGLGVAAIQWLPLGEWALVSSRRGGVDYEFASAFALPPANLLSVIFPYFYRLSDATTWWTLWQQWEIELYVGIPTLALIVVGLLFGRRIELAYFAVLGLVSLWIALAEYAPVLNLHQLLWGLPGFSFLRAPGRFSYLVVFACACLAAYGLEALGRERSRLRMALVGGLPPAIVLGVLLIALPVWHDWLASDPQRAVQWAQATYLATRAQYPIDPQLVVNGFVTSLDLTTIKTAWSLVLLALTVLAFAGWFVLGPERNTLGQAVFVGLLAVDLLVFAYDFHPRLPLLSFTPTLPVPPGQRVLMHDSDDFPDLQPDQLLAEGISTTDGYSSLPSERHVELASFTSTDPRLFDLWSAPSILEPTDAADATAVDGVRFRSQHPLMVGFGGSTPQVLDPRVAGTGLRLIGTLNYAYNVPQGQTVATLRVGNTEVPVRAGIELSERAYDRPSLKGLVQHQKAQVAFDFEETTPQGEDYIAHLYEANITIPVDPNNSIIFTPTNASVQVEIDGLGVIDTSGTSTSLDLANRDGLQRLDDQLIQNNQALPRAYVLPRTQAFSTGRHPDLTPTQLVASPDVDLHRMALIENDPSVATAPSGDRVAAPADSVVDLGPNEVRVVASADGPSYLILNDFYHRGWTVQVDGQPSRVFVANAVFRAVPIDAGTHVVDFRFEPVSQSAGAVVSALALLMVTGAIVWSVRRL
jgi:hypothetical protein